MASNTLYKPIIEEVEIENPDMSNNRRGYVPHYPTC